MKDKRIDLIIRQWRSDAGVHTPVLYKTFSPRDESQAWIYITTDQPSKLMQLMHKYQDAFDKANIFNRELEIIVEKADGCVF